MQLLRAHPMTLCPLFMKCRIWLQKISPCCFLSCTGSSIQLKFPKYWINSTPHRCKWGPYRQIPSTALVDLWERVGPWIVFLDEYRDHLPGSDTLPPDTRYALFVSFLRFMRKNDKVDQLIDESLALCVVVGRAWHHLSSSEDEEKGLHFVSDFLVRWFKRTSWNAAAFEGLVIGAGSRRKLASLVVTRFNRCLPSADSPVTDDVVSLLLGATYLVGHSCEAVRGVCDPAFRDALLSQGLITALTTVSGALSRSGLTIPVAEIILKGLFAALVEYLALFPRRTGIIEALRAGLLPAAFACATPAHIEVTRGSLLELLGDILPASTIYYSVLSQLRVSVVQMRDFDAASTFADTDLLEDWQSLLELIEDTGQILDKYKILSLTTKACDNLECVRDYTYNELKRCSGCSISYYCSSLCQSYDWREGHRQTCKALSSWRYEPSNITTRDKSFLRAIFFYDYDALREDIARSHLRFLEANPSKVPYALLDYSEGNCDITVRALVELESHVDCNLMQKAASSGRVRLHVMKVMEGDQERTLPFSLPWPSAMTEGGTSSEGLEDSDSNKSAEETN
ncbi:hypothetical protein C8R45DRAFT_970620 [Mycena sanguinolenta]|nr:hypothetical protein C8R45DRAFT_970620 [Mycena sanguinolenta]